MADVWFRNNCNLQTELCVSPVPTNRGEAELSGCWAKFLVLGLALLFLGKQETVEPTLEVSTGHGVCGYVNIMLRTAKQRPSD